MSWALVQRFRDERCHHRERLFLKFEHRHYRLRVFVRLDDRKLVLTVGAMLDLAINLRTI